jgi:hypothetical protein
MLYKLEKTFQEKLDDEMVELKDSYEAIKEGFLEHASDRSLEFEYEYENESGREIPDGFSYNGKIFSIRDTKLFNILVRGNLDQLKEVYDTPELYAQYLEEVFGSIDEYIKETQENIELGYESKEQEKEAA